MKIDLDQFNEAELRDLNRRIVERLRMLHQLRAHDQMLKFSIGDRVSFAPNDRPPVTGVLVKYNRKTVTVIADDGEQWNVSPALLTREDVIDAEPTPPKIIAFNEPRDAASL